MSDLILFDVFFEDNSVLTFPIYKPHHYTKAELWQKAAGIAVAQYADMGVVRLQIHQEDPE